jgi:hypothetical protein
VSKEESERDITGDHIADNSNNGQYDESLVSSGNVIYLSDIKENCAYFGFSDYYVRDLFEKRGIQMNEFYTSVKDHLKTTLLFFNKVVVHAVDIIRDEQILLILNEFSEYIKQGNILFLYPNSISEISINNLSVYVNDKIKQGEEGLEKFANDKRFAKEVVELLTKSNIMLHRNQLTEKSEDKSNRSEFYRLVLNDLVGDDKAKKTASEEASLYQIMHSSRLAKSHIESLTTALDRIPRSNPFSRKHFIDLFKSIVGFPTNETSAGKKKTFDELFFKIEERLCVLFSKLNAGNHFVVYSYFGKERSYLYYSDTVDRFIDERYRTDKNSLSPVRDLTPEEIMEFKKSPVKWMRFKLCYFCSYAKWKQFHEMKLIGYNDYILPSCGGANSACHSLEV